SAERDHDRDGCCFFLYCRCYRQSISNNHIRRQPYEFTCVTPHAIGVRRCPAIFKLNILAFRPSKFTQYLPECQKIGQCTRVAFGIIHQECDPPHALLSLRARPERPRGCRAAKRGYEFSSSDNGWHVPLPCQGCLERIPVML